MPAVTHEIVDGVGRLVLSRPDQSNSFDLPAARDMALAVEAVSVDDVRAITLTAEGKRFCAGGDVTSFLASDDPAAYLLDLALTGRMLSADEALDWGLVTSVVDDDAVEVTVAEIARTWADTAPAALGQARRLIRSSWETSGVEQGADESATIAAAVTGDEAQRLVKAFASR